MDLLDVMTFVAVSFDSRYIAAASCRELWMWDVKDVLGRKELSTTGMTSAHPHHNLQQSSAVSRHLIRNQSFNPLNEDMLVAFSSDGNQIMSGVGDKAAHSVNILCVKTSRLLRSLEGHSDIVTYVAFSPDGSHIASTLHDSTIWIWEASSNSVSRDDGGIPMDVRLNGDIGLPSVTKMKATRTLDWLSSEGGVWCCVLSCDGSRVVFGTQKGIICVWNHVIDTVECVLQGHSRVLSSVSFSSDEPQ
jgi:WD40 repeat protein